MDDKLQLLDNIDYMKRTHIERGIPRGPWKVSPSKSKILLVGKRNCIVQFLIFQDFGRILFHVLSSAGMSSKELASWKNVLTIFINGIAPAI